MDFRNNNGRDNESNETSSLPPLPPLPQGPDFTTLTESFGFVTYENKSKVKVKKEERKK